MYAMNEKFYNQLVWTFLNYVSNKSEQAVKMLLQKCSLMYVM